MIILDNIQTASGRIFKSDYYTVIAFPAQAFIRIVDADIAEVAAVFSDPVETSHIMLGRQHLQGYAKLVAVVPEAGAIKVVLSKE